MRHARLLARARALGTLVTALLGASATSAAAQGTLAGSVRDSLAGGGPLAGARVELAPMTALSSVLHVATADSAGRFAFRDVAPGRYLLGFSHPRLDTLGVELPPRAVHVPDDASPLDVPLATPSARTLAAAICGSVAPGSGAVIGRVSDAAPPGAAPTTRAAWPREALDTLVGAWWEDRPPGPGATTPVDRTAWVPVGPGGRFAVCDVRTHTPIRLELVVAPPLDRPALGGQGDGADAAVRVLTAPVVVTVSDSAPLVFRDLVRVADRSADARDVGAPAVDVRGAAAHAARVSGVVRDSAGAPVGGARVSVALATGEVRVARTDARGVFRLTNVPPGSHRIVAAAIGHRPGAALVRLGRGGVDADVVLGARLSVLDLVTVRDSRTWRDTEVARRMRGITGQYFTGDDVERMGVQSLGAVISRARAMRRVGTTRWGNPVFAGRREECATTVFVDGMELDWDAANQFAPPESIGGIEIYNEPTFAPMPYSFRRCALVLVWTKRYLYR